MSNVIRFPKATPLGPDFTSYGPAFGRILAAIHDLADPGYDACEVWCGLAATLRRLIRDEGMTTAEAAQAEGLPLAMVEEYRHAAGI
jgi:hypothetical protein